MNTKATIIINNNSYELDIISDTKTDTPILDVNNLYNKTKILTYDPGLTSTAHCKSSITYINGEKGILSHRGHDIKDLAKNNSFLDIAYLLSYDALPTQQNSKQFLNAIFNTIIYEKELKNIISNFSATTMPSIMGCFAFLATKYHSTINKEELLSTSIMNMATIVALIHRANINKDTEIKIHNKNYTHNFLQMLFNETEKEQNINETSISALEKILILHADHEQNASTATARMVCSTKANPFLCIASAVGSLSGPLHGGANEKVVQMLQDAIKNGSIKKCIERAKDPNDEFKLMGFGHRIYKNFDPRALVIKDICYATLKSIQNKEAKEMLECATELEKLILQDEYFIKRKLYPNVDFYSGIILHAIGIPRHMFTSIFTLSRVIGWLAQILEFKNDPDNKICRPRQIYTGK